ncbi:MAG: DUF1256 domain-containing protein [Clostridia bacterium]|nr:DUF1256 domain-containing protein [Clostridia bacterium]
MQEFTFVCIGTNKLVADSLGPRVGEELEKRFKEKSNIQIFGTMKEPIHFKNAKYLVGTIEEEKTILIDSAISQKAKIGDSYINIGGIELGKALGKSFYFPAMMNIKTIIGTKDNMPNWSIKQIEQLAQKVARQVTKVVEEL